MHKTPKLKDLFNDFYNQNINTRPGYQVNASSPVSRIRTGALDFLNFNAGPLNFEITGNTNLDSDLLNILAQTFIAHFYNTRIGYKDTETFYVSLSGFLNEELPLWSQFYKEAIYKHGAFITNAGQVYVDANGNLNFTENNTTSGTNTSNTTNTNDTTTQTDGTNNTDTNGTTHTDNNGSTSNNTTTKQDQNTQALDVDTTTPQDRINFNSDQISSGNLTGVYDFSYADSVKGNFNKNNLNTTVNGSTDSNNTTDGKTTNSTKGTTSNTTKVTGGTTSSVKGSNTTTTDGKHQQDTQNTTNTTTQERNTDVFSLARGINGLVNGSYLNLFDKAKKAGLFLLVY